MGAAAGLPHHFAVGCTPGNQRFKIYVHASQAFGVDCTLHTSAQVVAQSEGHICQARLRVWTRSLQKLLPVLHLRTHLHLRPTDSRVAIFLCYKLCCCSIAAGCM